ncbi:hypothetical protein PQX77_002847, partial [Marasmius sp. AFHP31]
MLAILAAIVILPPTAPPSPSFIELLLELPAGEVDLRLRSLHSVLNIRGGDVTIAVYHTSFTDFLLDSSRSGQFYIDRAARHEALACQWLRTLDKCVQANPSIILDPTYSSCPTSNVRRLCETWVSFCLIARQPTGEVLVRRDNLLQSMLSILPDQQELLTRLASVVLLPTCTVNSGQSRVLRDLIVGPGALRSLERCQLLVPPPESKLEPFFLEFLSNPSHEYYIDPQEYRNPVAQRWIRALVPTNQLGTDWGSRTLWGGWADFCCSIERPSDELLSDLERLDLTAVAISIALKPSYPGSSDWPAHFGSSLFFILAVERHRAGFEEIPPEHRPAKSPYYELDCLYHMVLHNANPDHGKVRLILAAILVLPGYLEPTPAHIELLLGLSAEEVDLTLRAMRSVLGIRGSGDAIRLFHTAFREYLIDGTSSNQPSSAETSIFFTKWIELCTSIPEPTYGLLDDLQNVDLASVYVYTGYLWESSFQSLVPWVRRYQQGPKDGKTEVKSTTRQRATIKPNGHPSQDNGRRETDGLDLAEGLVHKLQSSPSCFHLECPPGVSPQDDTVRWLVQFATRCEWRIRPGGSQPNTHQEDLRLTDCRCDLSQGSESRDPGHLAYQLACIHLVKAFISIFGKLVQTGAEDEHTIDQLGKTFRNMMDSSLLKHCCMGIELLSLFGTFLGLANGCSVMRIDSLHGEQGRINILQWIE